MKKPKFEFYRGDILALVVFFFVFKLGEVVFLLLVALSNAAIKNQAMMDGLIGFAPLVGLIVGGWVFYKMHAYYKRKSFAKEAETTKS